MNKETEEIRGSFDRIAIAVIVFSVVFGVTVITLGVMGII